MTALLILGWAMFVGGITFAAWCGMRVWMLRQDLFELRDNLWFAAREANALGDEAYRETRDTINCMIRIAPLISLNLLADISQIVPGGYRRAKTENKQLVRAIAETYNEFGSVIGRYVLFATAHGWWQVALHVLTLRRLDVNQLIKRTSKQARRACSTPEVRQAEWDDRHTPHLAC